MKPFEAQPIYKLKRKLPKAFERIWDAYEIKEETERNNAIVDRPGLHQEHIFDFPSGCRLIISREDYREEGIKFHVSASWIDGADDLVGLKHKLEIGEDIGMDDLVDLINNHLKELGFYSKITVVGLSPKNVVHVFIERVQ